MAKEQNRSEAIRDYFGKHGIDVRPRDVIADLKNKGITVSSALVAQARKKLVAGKKPAKRGPKPGSTRKTRKASTSRVNGEITLSQLTLVREFAPQVGGVDSLKSICDALETFGG